MSDDRIFYIPKLAWILGGYVAVGGGCYSIGYQQGKVQYERERNEQNKKIANLENQVANNTKEFQALLDMLRQKDIIK